jgi:hypothetical protein
LRACGDQYFNNFSLDLRSIKPNRCGRSDYGGFVLKIIRRQTKVRQRHGKAGAMIAKRIDGRKQPRSEQRRIASLESGKCCFLFDYTGPLVNGYINSDNET